MATAAPLGGVEPKRLEKKPVKFSNLLCEGDPPDPEGEDIDVPCL